MSEKTCGCGGDCDSKKKLIFSCSGAADTAEICDRAARQLTKRGEGKMYCLAGVGGRVADVLENTKAAGKILALDGCNKDCAKNTLLQAGFTEFTHLRVTDLGLVKGESPANSDRIGMVVEKAAALLNS